VITLQPKNADAHYYLAMTELDLDNRYKAKEVFEKTLSIQPEYNGVNVELGAIIEWEQDFRKAVKYYEKEIAIDAKCVRAYQRLGDLYRSYEMDFEKAVEMLKKALELDPNHVPSLLNYGNTLFNMDQLGRAAEQFEMALQIDPGDLTANYNLALMYEYSEKKDLAIDRWKRFLKLNPPAEWKVDANKHLRGLGQ
jgi:tetratricopeptide (TPR) repeat protein